LKTIKEKGPRLLLASGWGRAGSEGGKKRSSMGRPANEQSTTLRVRLKDLRERDGAVASSSAIP